jgi:hypothetical protein
MNRIKIGITGHRLLTNEQIKKVTPVLEDTIAHILFECREKDPAASFIAITPLAEGADTLFAQVAKSFGLQLQVILPFEKGEYIKHFSTSEKRREFEEMLNTVKEADITELNSVLSKELDDLYLEVGKEVVNRSDYLVAVWNEDEAKGKGGTADIVAYAKDRHKQIRIINPGAGS